jgi:hypothetical protein
MDIFAIQIAAIAVLLLGHFFGVIRSRLTQAR